VVVRGGEVIKINELSDWCWQRRAPVGGSLFTVGCCGCSSITAAAALAVLSFHGVGCGIRRARVMAGPSGPRLMTSRCRGGFGGRDERGRGRKQRRIRRARFPATSARQKISKRPYHVLIIIIILLYNMVRRTHKDLRQKYRAATYC